MITIPADNMNASLIEFIEQCLARIEAEVEIRLCAARKLRADAYGAKTNGTIAGSQSGGPLDVRICQMENTFVASLVTQNSR